MSNVESGTVVFIHESVAQSFVRDAVTVAMFVGAMLLARATGSSALEWVSALCIMIVLIGKAAKIARDSEKTPDEARAWLDENFPKGGE